MSTALLIIDAQVNMFEPEPVYGANQVLVAIQNLVEAATAAGALVIFVQHTGGAEDPDERDTPGWQLHPWLAARKSVPVVEKHTPDAFYQTSLPGLLGANGVTRIVIAGMQTEYCIDTTTRRACSMGYEVTLAADAHSTLDGDLPAAQIIAHHNHVLRAFARVLPAVAITFESLPALVKDDLLTAADQRAIATGLEEWKRYETWLGKAGPKPYWPFTHPGRVADALRALWDRDFKPHGQHVAPPRWEMGIAPQFIQPMAAIPMAFRRACVESVAKAMDHLLQNPRNPFAPQLKELGHGLWSYEARDLRLIYVPATTTDAAGKERNYVFLIWVAPGIPVKNPFA